MSGILLGRGATVHADSINSQPSDSVTRCGRSSDMITGVDDAVTCKRCVTLTESDARKAESAAAAVAAITDRADEIRQGGYAAPFTVRMALAEAAMFIGYTREDAGRLADNAFYLDSRYATYGDECDQHPAMRRDQHGDCEACEVLRQNGPTEAEALAAGLRPDVEPWDAELLTDRAETDNVIMVDLRDECDVVAIVPTDAADNGTASDAKTVLRPWVTVSTREIDGVLTEVQVAYEDDGRPAATRYVPVETADNGTVTTHWTLAEVAALPRNEAGATLVTLRDGDTADAPGTTKKVFAGIGLITFTFYGDGGVTAYPADGGGVYVRYLTETEKSARRETPADNGTGHITPDLVCYYCDRPATGYNAENTSVCDRKRCQGRTGERNGTAMARPWYVETLLTDGTWAEVPHGPWATHDGAALWAEDSFEITGSAYRVINRSTGEVGTEFFGTPADNGTGEPEQLALPEPESFAVQAQRAPGGWLTVPDHGPWADRGEAVAWAAGAAVMVPDSSWRVIGELSGEIIWEGPIPPATSGAASGLAAFVPEMPAAPRKVLSVSGGPLTVGSAGYGPHARRKTAPVGTGGPVRTGRDIDGPARYRAVHGKRKGNARRQCR